MFSRLLIILGLVFSLYSCSKDKVIYESTEKVDPYILYKEGLESFKKNDFFFASKKFTEAELNFEIVDLAAKAAIMSSFSLYGINFYSQATENLERYLKTYPSDKNVIYAHYLIAVINFEQITDEKKDLKPLLEAENKINFFLKEFPNSEYAIDLRFKKDLIQNQLAAKELFVAKYYTSIQKWVPAINRFKIIVNKYDKTIFIEEALHRLVEIHYHLGLENEAKKYAKILGYNYNSSRWFEESYKLLNKEYKMKKIDLKDKKKKDNENFFKKILKKIK
ncbi:outer membrane protein assembly factor BamD [Pelagibacteraceae bacterium]|nr:outer membrane protein assembly factor BamD [Pelagibacteraceae bacterium]